LVIGVRWECCLPFGHIGGIKFNSTQGCGQASKSHHIAPFFTVIGFPHFGVVAPTTIWLISCIHVDKSWTLFNGIFDY
jgi:hypothetical protein